MKKTLFLLNIVFLNFYYSYSQTQSNVATPKLNPVTAYITPEDQSGTRAYYDWWYGTQLYPQNTMITTYDNYSSTGRFNCHGYAWYLEGSFSNPRWIGYYYQTDEDVYMSDGSYVQVLNEMYPGKVSWGSGDHTAMTTSTQGVWISKWNRYPLFRHAWNNTLYGTSNLKYYVLTSISGSTAILCNSSSRNFTVVSIPNASYSWSVGNGLTKTENGYSCTVTSNSSYSGISYIEVTITSPIGGGQTDVKTSKRIEFWVGTPIVSITGPDEGCTYTSHTFRAQPTHYLSNPTSYSSWGIDPNDGYISTSGAGEYAYITFYNEYSVAGYDVEVKGTNTCGTGSFGYGNIWIYDCYYYTITPNPASDIVTINRVKASEDTDGKTILTKSDDENTTCDIQIIDYYGSLHLQTKKSRDSFTLPVSNLKDGTYFVKITNGNKTSSLKLVVKH